MDVHQEARERVEVLALLICAASIVAGLFFPVALPPTTWKLLLAGYVLVAAGVPVWIFLQSRDFINVHILYAGLGVLLVTLVAAGLRGGVPSGDEPLAVFDPVDGPKGLGGPFWPALFTVVACGAVGGFHSLCAGGTTCKQLSSEPDARRVGYWGMLLESFLAVCVIAVLVVGATKANYLRDVHPGLLGAAGKSNPILGFAMAVGNAVHLAFGAPITAGAIAGMILMEGFLVTTLDTAIRLTRYLLEEIWRVLLKTGAACSGRWWATTGSTPGWLWASRCSSPSPAGS
jgi:carbon starvation protein